MKPSIPPVFGLTDQTIVEAESTKQTLLILLHTSLAISYRKVKGADDTHKLEGAGYMASLAIREVSVPFLRKSVQQQRKRVPWRFLRIGNRCADS